ncbi:ABC transporter ATP-binding protein [Roseomonas terrae]|uniref:ABC transporter ATP-binding protein n=2 Tax=Neoroseomonas terrae TaxID=424799 RepID=A0ABS5EC29_9PROT|nr:ABC transporter ATP-binding protein [Neoroseomonas terrae]
MGRIAVDSVTVRYGDRLAVDGVSFTARAGDVVALVGPNGSGKSSLLRAAAGLLRCGGQVRCDGRIAFLPQDNGARAALTVMETVLLGRIRALGMRVPETEVAHAVSTLDRLGIADLAMRLVPELSGGQRQLVFLAQMLASEPAILLLDEPTSALDLRNQLSLLSLLRGLARGCGLLVIVVLHDLNAAARFADRMLVLCNGRLVADGPGGEVLTETMLANVYGIRAEIGRSNEGVPLVVPICPIGCGDDP